MSFIVPDYAASRTPGAHPDASPTVQSANATPVYEVQVRTKQQVEQVARRARLPWNNEYYANYADTERSWDEAVKYGFISAGGSSWYTRTLGSATLGADGTSKP